MAQTDGQYQFKWKEPTSFSLSQTDWRSTVMRAARRGILEVSDNAADGANLRPENIDEQLLYDNLVQYKSGAGPALGFEDGFPIAGHSLWWGERNTFGGTSGNPEWYANSLELCVHPFMLCDNVDMVRDVKNKRLFHVNCTYSTPGGIDWTDYYQGLINQTAIAMPSTVAEYPYIRRRIWGDEYKPIAEKAKDSLGAPNESMRLPTGSQFAEPFMRQHPTKTYIQLQYEEFAFPFDIEPIIDERLFAVNNDDFAGNTPNKPAAPYTDPNGESGDIWYPVPRWKIADIQFEMVDIPTEGVGDVTLNRVYLMQYRLEHSLASGGWMDRRGLIDKHFLKTADDLSSKEKHTDNGDLTTLTERLLNIDGTLKTDQTTAPLYKDYEVQPRISFSFLKDTP